MFARMLSTPFAALLRLLRSSANNHPLVFSVTPHDSPAPYPVDR